MIPKIITLTHANNGQKIDIAVALMAGWYHSPGHGCTHVCSSTGMIFPAKESREEITRLYQLATGTEQPVASTKE